jgi:acyl-CoA synthetase (AMP-forming)/AMP-acid ligase II
MAEIRIVGEDGEELPRGQAGEIVIKAESQAS